MILLLLILLSCCLPASAAQTNESITVSVDTNGALITPISVPSLRAAAGLSNVVSGIAVTPPLTVANSNTPIPLISIPVATATQHGYFSTGLYQILTNKADIDWVMSNFVLGEDDPTFWASPAADITTDWIAHWQLAYGWGDHGTNGYLTNEPAWLASPFADVADPVVEMAKWDSGYTHSTNQGNPHNTQITNVSGLASALTNHNHDASNIVSGVLDDARMNAVTNAATNSVVKRDTAGAVTATLFRDTATDIGGGNSIVAIKARGNGGDTNALYDASASKVRAFLGATNEYNVKTYGATGDNATDDTAAIQSAITAAGAAKGMVLFPPGLYLVSSQLSVSNHYVTLRGMGVGVSNVRFDPTADATCVLFQGPPNRSLVGGAVENLSFISSDTQYAKTAIQVANVEEWRCDHVTVGFGGNQWHDTSQLSIGLRIGGRQFIRVEQTDVCADRPIVLERNPYRAAFGSIDIDQSTFSDMLLLCYDGLTRPNIEIADGFHLFRTTFERMSWTLGGWGLRWIESANTNTSVSLQLTLDDIRWEQSTNASGYCVQIEKDYDLLALSLRGIYGGWQTHGYRLRHTLGTSLTDIWHAGTSGTALDVDTTVRMLTLHNCFWQYGSTASLGGLRTVESDRPQTGPLPSNARYDHRAIAMSPLTIGDVTLDVTNAAIAIGAAVPTNALTVVGIISASGAVVAHSGSARAALSHDGSAGHLVTDGNLNLDPATGLTVAKTLTTTNLFIGPSPDTSSPFQVDNAGNTTYRGRMYFVGSALGLNEQNAGASSYPYISFEHNGIRGAYLGAGSKAFKTLEFGGADCTNLQVRMEIQCTTNVRAPWYFQSGYTVWDSRLTFGTGPTNMAAGDHGHAIGAIPDLVAQLTTFSNNFLSLSNAHYALTNSGLTFAKTLTTTNLFIGPSPDTSSPFQVDNAGNTTYRGRMYFVGSSLGLNEQNAGASSYPYISFEHNGIRGAYLGAGSKAVKTLEFGGADCTNLQVRMEIQCTTNVRAPWYFQSGYTVWDSRLTFGTGPTNMAAGDHSHTIGAITDLAEQLTTFSNNYVTVSNQLYGLTNLPAGSTFVTTNINFLTLAMYQIVDVNGVTQNVFSVPSWTSTIIHYTNGIAY